MTSKKRQGRVNSIVLALCAIVGLYAASLMVGQPQRATQIVVDSVNARLAEDPAVPKDARASAEAPPLWTITPFLLLLGAIAFLPLMDRTEHWWESNANRFLVALVLALITLGYYAFLHDSTVERHWPAHRIVFPVHADLQFDFVLAILGNAMLGEFLPFIVLLFSLYTIAGGVRIEGDLRANPLTNASFMAAGGLMASFVGTTGAAMLLIRPLLETNSQRRHVRHTVVFFIFIVCNCGGCLLPIGDPPLFLGYLQGVEFTWTLSLWRSWLLVNGVLLGIYCLADQFIYYPRESARDLMRDMTQVKPLKISGAVLNLPLLMAVVLSVALLDPSRTLLGTDWHPWMFLRETVLLTLVAISLQFSSQKIRTDNDFSFYAIIEVAVLFMGIFICMQPALQILSVRGSVLADTLSPAGFFWTTGILSSFLDNAPTYLVFFKAAQIPGLPGPTGGVPEPILVAISLGAVFMGAMSYIGNGPNFMVKAIAEKSGVRMPSFFGYMGYSFLILLPVLLLNQFQFITPMHEHSAAAAQVVVLEE